MHRASAGCVVVVASLLASACDKPAPQLSSDSLAPAVSALDAAATHAVTEPTPQVPDEALAWMEGKWCGKDEDQQIEETWFAPHADETTGMSRTIAGGRVISFEFMRIANLEGTWTLIAQPGGAPPTNFARTDGGEGWIRFENKQHDYPQRIEYKRTAEGLTAEIGGPGAEGKEEVISYRYTPCKA
jgi:hypothetical protein